MSLPVTAVCTSGPLACLNWLQLPGYWSAGASKANYSSAIWSGEFRMTQLPVLCHMLRYIHCQHAAHGPIRVQKMFQDRTEVTSHWWFAVPRTVLTLSLVAAICWGHISSAVFLQLHTMIIYNHEICHTSHIYCELKAKGNAGLHIVVSWTWKGICQGTRRSSPNKIGCVQVVCVWKFGVG